MNFNTQVYMLGEVTFIFIPNSKSPWNTEISLNEVRKEQKAPMTVINSIFSNKVFFNSDMYTEFFRHNAIEYLINYRLL